jgi:hypothetical protein
MTTVTVGPIEGGNEVGWESMDWIYLAENRDQWQACINSTGFIKCWQFLEFFIFFILVN